jgi:hypothetical protein
MEDDVGFEVGEVAVLNADFKGGGLADEGCQDENYSVTLQSFRFPIIGC